MTQEVKENKIKIEGVGELLNKYGKAGYILIAIASFIFYQYGYIFLYGFYFGGNGIESIPIMEAIVNPIPFNYKSIIGVGFIIFICTIILVCPILAGVNAKNIIDKTLGLIINLIIVLAMCYVLEKVFGMNLYIVMIMIDSMIILAIILMYRMSQRVKNIRMYLLMLVGLLVYNIALFIECMALWYIHGRSLEKIIPIIFLIGFDVGIYFFATVKERVENCKNLNQCIIGEIAIYLAFLMYLIQIGIQASYCLCYQIMAFIIMLMQVINIKQKKYKEYNLWSESEHRYEKEITSKIYKIKDVQKDEDVTNSKIIIVLVMFITIIIGTIGVCLYSILGLGVTIGGDAQRTSKDVIMYITDEDKAAIRIEGNIVAQSGNTYYISTQDRQLLRLNTLEVIAKNEKQ